jgi:hypothetical protein
VSSIEYQNFRKGVESDVLGREKQIRLEYTAYKYLYRSALTLCNTDTRMHNPKKIKIISNIEKSPNLSRAGFESGALHISDPYIFSTTWHNYGVDTNIFNSLLGVFTTTGTKHKQPWRFHALLEILLQSRLSPY